MSQMQAEILKHSTLFYGLDEDAMQAIALIMKTLSLPAGAVLMMQDEEPDGCFAVLDGMLKVSTITAEGEETVLAVLGSGEIAGEIGLIDGAPRSATVTALKDCELAYLSTRDFKTIADSNPKIYQHMLKIMAERIRASNTSLTAYQRLPVSGRLAHILLRLSEAFGEPVDDGRILIRQNFTQEQIGIMAGTARENVSRQINKWRQDKTITRISRYYCIEDADKLRQLTNL